MAPFRATSEYPEWEALAALVRGAFAEMAETLASPPGTARATAEELKARASKGSAWVIADGTGPVACLFTRASRDVSGGHYLGALAVAAKARGQGLARALVTSAEEEARSLGRPLLVLDTAAELTDLRRRFERMGFSVLSEADGVVTFTRPVR